MNSKLTIVRDTASALQNSNANYFGRLILAVIFMKAIKVESISTFQNTHGVEAKKLYTTKNAEVIIMNLKPGQSLKKHTTPVDVFFYILEGKGEVEIGNETKEVEKDTLIESPKDIPHLLRNTGTNIFRFLVVKLS